MTSLPIIDCNNCGACCREIGTPPFLGCEIYELPEHLRDEVLEKLNQDPERENSRLPCFWFDTDTNKCMHYEHRPNICRDFEVKSPSCLSYREYHNIKDSLELE